MGLEAMVKGLTGELKTKFVNKLLLDENYRIFNNVIIEAGIGSTQIDHVIVSKFGLFVIETKDKTGWIFGDHKREKWTQSIYGKIYQFQNPFQEWSLIGILFSPFPFAQLAKKRRLPCYLKRTTRSTTSY